MTPSDTTNAATEMPKTTNPPDTANTAETVSKPGRTVGAEETDTARSASCPPSRRTALAARVETARQAIIARAPVVLSRLFPPRATGTLAILMYHRVTDEVPEVECPTSNVTPEQFRRQMAGLVELGYRPWPLRRALEYHRQAKAIPPKVFVVTFDDGYANNYTRAYPVLREHGIAATIFVPTAYLDSPKPMPFDLWSGVGREGVDPDAWRPLTTEECREMLGEGLIDLGVHTHTHTDLRGRPELLLDELATSAGVLRDRFGIEHPTFAFPFGKVSTGFAAPELMASARQAGMACALTTENRLVQPGDDPFGWSRLTAAETDTARTLAAKIDGWYDFLRDGWRRLRRRTTGNSASDVTKR